MNTQGILVLSDIWVLHSY